MNIAKKQPNTRLRLNLVTFIIYIIGIILLLQLFNLQIINGAEYRETSNTRLTRESTLYAARGDITDSSGVLLATVENTYSAELYKTISDDETLNEIILNIMNVLEENGDSYTDTFPITVNPFSYTYTDETKIANWLKTYDLDSDTTAEEAFEYFKNKYSIETDSDEDARKIIVIRYRISTEGYSSTKSISIADNLSDESVSTFSEQNDLFGGLTIVTKATRTYPYGSLASHILGYVGKIDSEEYAEKKSEGYLITDYIGKTGVENLFEKYLKGTNGTKQIDMDVDGTVTNEYVEEEAIQGATISLTIDANLQAVTEQALQDTIDNIKAGNYSSKAYDATAGAIVVMNVKTGEVLAMASNPDYEPELFVNGISTEKYNEYKEVGAMFNRAIQGTYAPGSTFKMLTAIAGLQEGAITTTEKINDSGPYPLGHHPACWLYNQSGRTHGYLNVTQALQKSCNYFFYETGYRVGIEQIDRYAKYFGLGVKTGIELPSEASGTLASPEVAEANGETWSVGATLNAAIGQGYHAFTPIQMAKYISILVNGGDQVDPTIIKSIITQDGTEVSKSEIKAYTQEILGTTDEEVEDIEISQEYIDVILEGMRDVTSENGGTAYSIFKNFDITIGGKTGSAQTASGITNAWFVGFAPYDDPEIAIVVVIEGGGTGTNAAYAARDVIAQYFGMNEEDIVEDVTAIPYTEIQN